jgi:HK97 family phage prohead protease
MRVADGAHGVTLIGYPIVYNVATTIAGSFVEIISPGAFRNAIKNYDVRALFAHSYEQVLGRLSAGTLRLSEDSAGIRCEIDLPNSRADIAELVARRDLTGMSMLFSPLAEDWDYPTVGLPTRTILDAELYECSIVSEPAYPTTSIYVKDNNRSAAEVSNMMVRKRMKLKLLDAITKTN